MSNLQNPGCGEDKKYIKYVFLYNKNTNHKCCVASLAL